MRQFAIFHFVLRASCLTINLAHWRPFDDCRHFDNDGMNSLWSIFTFTTTSHVTYASFGQSLLKSLSKYVGYIVATKVMLLHIQYLTLNCNVALLGRKKLENIINFAKHWFLGGGTNSSTHGDLLNFWKGSRLGSIGTIQMIWDY